MKFMMLRQKIIQIRDFPVFGCAQPTETGFKAVLDRVREASGGEGEGKVKLVWFNMRQEPVVYIDSQPHAPRHPDHMHDNLEVDGVVSTCYQC